MIGVSLAAMGRPQRNAAAIAELAAHLAPLQQRKPSTAKAIQLWSYANLDGLTVGNDSIRKALRGRIDPTQCAVELLMSLVGYYGVGPSDLGPVTERRLRPILAFGAGGYETS